jgi:hypothetical protein
MSTAEDQKCDCRISEINRMTLRPGDIVVIRVSNIPTLDQVERVKAHFRSILDQCGHDKSGLIILGPDTSIEVIGPDAG